MKKALIIRQTIPAKSQYVSSGPPASPIQITFHNTSNDIFMIEVYKVDSRMNNLEKAKEALKDIKSLTKS